VERMRRHLTNGAAIENGESEKAFALQSDVGSMSGHFERGTVPKTEEPGKELG